MNDLHFDPYQWAGRRGTLPASAETGIAFTDYDRMHTETHHANPAAWVPPFALNNKQLQQVLLLRAWRYIHGRGIPAAQDRDKINRLATQKALRGYSSVGADAPRIQHEMVKKHAAAVRKAGSWMGLHAAIAYRSRLGMNSVEVAESLGTTPVAVRQALWRMRDAAKDLGFDTGRAGYTAGKQRRPPKSRRVLNPKYNRVDVAKAVQLRKAGNTIKAIARQFGVTAAAIYFALRRAGTK